MEFVPFIMQKGREFDAAIAEHLSTPAPMTTVAQSRDDIRDPAAAEPTFDLLAEGQPIVHQGVLHDHETLTYGAPDLLVRSDIFADIFPGHISAEEAAVPAPGLGQAHWHYIVIDINFTTLHLLAGDEVGGGGSTPVYQRSTLSLQPRPG